MNILGWFLIIIGSFFCFGRILNQREMYRLFLRVSSEKGIINGIQKYLTIEIIMGFGLGVLLLSMGFYFLFDEIPLKIIFFLFTILFYVLSTQISYVNIFERNWTTPRTSLTPFQLNNPILSSILPFSHPFFLVFLYLILGFFSYYF